MKISLLIKKIVCVCLIFALNVSNNFLHDTQKINKVYAEELINLDIPAWDGTTASSFAGGKGTQEDPYQISNGEELSYLAEVINENNVNYNNNNCYFELTNDIDLANKEWTPIGVKVEAFWGFKASFNGNDYDVYNLKITTPDLPYYGLFGSIYNSPSIHDINIINSNINVSHTKDAKNLGTLRAGILAGIADTNNIYNCYASGTITVLESCQYDSLMQVGGLVGICSSNSNQIIYNCCSLVNITTTNAETSKVAAVNVGGVFGYLEVNNVDDVLNIQKCYADGDIIINTEVSDMQYIGGLFGELSNVDDNNIEISYCNYKGNIYTYGNIDASNRYVAGLIAKNDYISNVRECYSTCNLILETPCNYVSGLICNNTINVYNCHTQCNIKVANAKTSAYIAGLCSEVSDTIIDQCYSLCNIEILNDINYVYVGGLVGEMFMDSNISNSYSIGNITAQNCNNSYIGGLVAYGAGLTGYLTTQKLNNCFSSCNIVAGEISTDPSLSAAVGGLIGSQSLEGSQSGSSCTITDCYSAHGSISLASTDENSSVGGLIGGFNYGNINNTNSLTNCYSGNIIRVSSPADPNNIGNFIGTTDAKTISNCYFDKNLSEYVSASENTNETNIIGLTTKQMTGYSALENMPGLFEVTDGNTDPAFDVVDTFDINSNKYYYSHYPQLKIFLNNKDWNAICYSEFSTRAKLTNMLEDISKIQNLLEYLVDNVDRKFEYELDVIKCNENQIENKLNAIFMKICGGPVCDTEFNFCN